MDFASNNTNNRSAVNHATTSDYRAADSRVQFERFDSSSNDHRDEKLVFKYIQRLEDKELRRHLIETESRFDVTEIGDRSGYSPLHFAAYKNSEIMAEILCEFVSLILFTKDIRFWVSTATISYLIKKKSREGLYLKTGLTLRAREKRDSHLCTLLHSMAISS